jgi:hypothetical protein
MFLAIALVALFTLVNPVTAEASELHWAEMNGELGLLINYPSEFAQILQNYDLQDIEVTISGTVFSLDRYLEFSFTDSSRSSMWISLNSLANIMTSPNVFTSGTHDFSTRMTVGGYENYSNTIYYTLSISSSYVQISNAKVDDSTLLILGAFDENESYVIVADDYDNFDYDKYRLFHFPHTITGETLVADADWNDYGSSSGYNYNNSIKVMTYNPSINGDYLNLYVSSPQSNPVKLDVYQGSSYSSGSTPTYTPTPTPTYTPTPTSTPRPTATPIPDNVNDEYIYVLPDAAPLPYDNLDTVTDADSAVSAIVGAVSILTPEEKENPTNLDLLALYSEVAASHASTQTIDGNSITLDLSNMSPLSSNSIYAVSQAEEALDENGATPERQVRRELRFVLSEATDQLNITIDPSAINVDFDKVRVEAPFVAVVFPKEFVQAAVADGTSYTVSYSAEGSQTLSAYKNSYIAAAVSGAGCNTVASKPVKSNYSVSLPGTQEGTVVDETGKLYPAKPNPATKTLDYAVNGDKVRATYQNKDMTKDFSDIQNINRSMRDAIQFLAGQGIINGITETTFAPGQSITRAQLTQLIVSAITKLNLNASVYFSDVSQNDWMRPAVGTGKDLGIIAGNPDGTFLPNNTITKDQIVAIASRTLSQEMGYKRLPSPGTELSRFSDKESIPEWAWSDVALASKNDLFAKATSGLFNPSSNMTRGDAAVIIKRLFDKLWK